MHEALLTVCLTGSGLEPWLAFCSWQGKPPGKRGENEEWGLQHLCATPDPALHVFAGVISSSQQPAAPGFVPLLADEDLEKESIIIINSRGRASFSPWSV